MISRLLVSLNLSDLHRFRLCREVSIILGLTELGGLGGGFLYLGRAEDSVSAAFFALMICSSYINSRLSWYAQGLQMKLAVSEVQHL